MRDDVAGNYVAQPAGQAWDTAGRVWGDAEMLAAARERAQFLATASRQVSGSLNLPHTVRQALRSCVPQLADWAQIMIVDRTEARFVSLRSGDGATMEAETAAPSRGDVSGQGRILTTGRPELLHVTAAGDPPDGLSALVPDRAMREQVAALRPADVLCIPLIARGTTFGTLTLARRAGYGFATEDVALAEELGSRIALAVDAARRYAERSTVAAVLQASLRPPEPPKIEGTQVAVRYRAAADHTDIGGDFYDVWGLPGDFSMVLGDVSGKGIEAAVVTGQARHSVRGAAHIDGSPSAVLGALNALLADGGSGRFVTAFHARFHAAAGGGLDFTAASAGHPPPLILRADGSVEPLQIRGMAAGLIPDVRYAETTGQLAVGDTLVAYTDGVTEAGDHSVRRGTERLTRLLENYSGASVEALVEAIEMDVLERAAGAHRDDMAVLAVRPTR